MDAEPGASLPLDYVRKIAESCSRWGMRQLVCDITRLRVSRNGVHYRPGTLEFIDKLHRALADLTQVGLDGKTESYVEAEKKTPLPRGG